MVLPKFEYLTAATIEEASNLQVELGAGAKIMAGGTDIIPPMRDKVLKCDYIIDIKRIPGLDAITYDEREGLRIGALTKLYDIQTSALVKEKNRRPQSMWRPHRSATREPWREISATLPRPRIRRRFSSRWMRRLQCTDMTAGRGRFR